MACQSVIYMTCRIYLFIEIKLAKWWICIYWIRNPVLNKVEEMSRGANDEAVLRIDTVFSPYAVVPCSSLRDVQQLSRNICLRCNIHTENNNRIWTTRYLYSFQNDYNSLLIMTALQHFDIRQASDKVWHTDLWIVETSFKPLLPHSKVVPSR